MLAYAEALYLANGRQLNGEAVTLLTAVLRVQPNTLAALGLLGEHANALGDYTKALGYWRRMIVWLPPGSVQAKRFAAKIADAEKMRKEASKKQEKQQ